ncbi:LpqE protein [Mycolicibacterium mageritense DSM 44476 = CIP 104973]|uniref:Lipoprotein LpqE n=1 Tax=Mycolicibacterium mageritense TaxID=53462 RepID=A0AAI8TRX9_MYCME|nr:hypothetical protein [Mycolicibacterium mageritense]OKH82416.1 hypothetical protein EB73_18200 [Mycobacterium sp. SWH-M3]MCC9180958.1 hypothetical protein [Mycolicibacterium mageritense]TXI57645.1 MAG: hypothetical protein E6Q55_25465 [Mycolicibacterium mageritense]CDO22473.1 LpqE protein [Mycolicibacterium mageritense DSM 44476 = CIP 104973]BBX34054.1 hypothetical protein MMAGJ_33360 [Mycolicibacterium mageritense]
MNRFTLRASVGLAACGLAAAALTGCGAGQVSQTATQEPAVNGTNAQAGQVSLRNVHLRAPQQKDYVEPGSTVELLFVAVNGSSEADNKLTSITSDVGQVTLSGDSTVPANGVLLVGEPDGQIASVEHAEKADAITAEVTLSKPITNGITYDFTFNFENGKTTVAVPISAGNEPRRDKTGEGEEAAEGDTGGHH